MAKFPYTKEIDLAFDQIAEFLFTAKVIGWLLGGVILVLVLNLLALLALLVTVNPDLEAERKATVTPVLKRATGWAVRGTSGLATAERASEGERRRGGEGKDK